jgi:dTDP-4-dehydrorhamnose reductase
MTSKNLLKKRWDNKILILGGGYIGTHLENYLKPIYDCEILQSSNVNYQNKETLSKYILNKDVRLLINCSGFTGRPNVDEGEFKKEECWDLNVTSPLRINNLCNKLGVKYYHISSGCIYNGYSKHFTEIDKPNFGLFDVSSFYSKSKHAFELLSKEMDNKIIRIRMPITPDDNPRNYLNKILKYDNLIEFKNSKTYIPDLCIFIDKLIQSDNLKPTLGQDIYNVVNPKALWTSDLCQLMGSLGVRNHKWSFVDMQDLDIKAPRSNCVLSSEKANKVYKMRTESEIIKEVYDR